MIQGYRMAGPPPHGEPPAAPPSGERKWPVWLGFAALAGAFIAQFFVQIVALVASGADKLDDMPEGADARRPGARDADLRRRRARLPPR